MFMAEIKIAVISDSHGLIRPSLKRHLLGCSALLHAGDILRESNLDELAICLPVYAVRGNCDNAPWAFRLQDILRFEIGGVRFLMVHDRRNVPRNLDGVQIIIHGHTHRYSEEWMDGRLWLNPGTCGIPRFGSESTLALLSLGEGSILVRRVDL